MLQCVSCQHSDIQVTLNNMFTCEMISMLLLIWIQDLSIKYICHSGLNLSPFVTSFSQIYQCDNCDSSLKFLLYWCNFIKYRVRKKTQNFKYLISLERLIKLNITWNNIWNYWNKVMIFWGECLNVRRRKVVTVCTPPLLLNAPHESFRSRESLSHFERPSRYI